MCPQAIRFSLLPPTLALLLLACSQDGSSEPSGAGEPPDASDGDALNQEDTAVPDAGQPDVQADVQEAAVDAGPSSCEEPCAAACADNTAIEGACAACADAVCSDYRAEAEATPNRETFIVCLEGCGTDASCPDACCNKYAVACAWEVAFQMCVCGFPEDSCVQDCETTCVKGELTEACGVCTSQSPCSFATFAYLFAQSRFSHQDCVTTCASSELSLDECLDLCRDDYPEAATAYDALLQCACGE